MKTIWSATLVLLTASTVAFAQANPPPPIEAPAGPPPPEKRDEPVPRGPRGGGGPGPGPGMRPGGPGGPGMEGPGGGGGPLGRNERFEQLRNYLGVIDAFSRQSRDASQAGIAAVIAAGDILKPRGTDVAIDYFSKLLPEVKNPAVRRAVRIQLADLYKAAGKQDQALEQLRELMIAEPTESDLKALENTPPPPRGPNP